MKPDNILKPHNSVYQLRLDEPLKQKVIKLAHLRGTRMSNVLREFLIEYVEKNLKKLEEKKKK